LWGRRQASRSCSSTGSQQINRLMGYHGLMALSRVRRKPRPIDPTELEGDVPGVAPTRVDLIRAAARRHFAEHGYDAASMREIAADAGITIATLYFHCATKEQLLFDVLERAMDRL